MSYDAGIDRFSTAGVPDSTFDADGVRTIDASSDYEFVYGIAVQPDGDILIGGTVDVDPQSDDHEFLAARVHGDGSTDETFGDGGVAITALGPGSDWGRSLNLMPDGRFVMTGWKESSFQRDVAVARFGADGVLDPTFGDGGVALFTTVAEDAWATASALLPNGKLMVTGTAQDDEGQQQITVLMVDGAGLLDPSWDMDGIVHSTFESPDAGAAIAIQPDGRVVVTGTSLGYAMVVARYLNDLNVGTVHAHMDPSSLIRPNPSAGDFTIALPSDARTIIITDAQGREQERRAVRDTRNSSFHIDVPGVYGVSVLTEAGLEVQRVVVR